MKSLQLREYKYLGQSYHVIGTFLNADGAQPLVAVTSAENEPELTQPFYAQSIDDDRVFKISDNHWQITERSPFSGEPPAWIMTQTAFLSDSR